METLNIYFEILNQNPVTLFLFVGVLGAFIGSFINVVVARLPRMMHLEHKLEIEEYVEQTGGSVSLPESKGLPPTLNGRSECPHCHTQIPFYLNIPIFGFFIAQMKCVACKEPISWRYPLVEAATLAITLGITAVLGASLTTVLVLLITWVLIAAILIDLDELLLPDSMMFSLLWIALVASALPMEGTLPSQDAILGAVAGYLCLWSLYWIFKLVTGKDGMGYGDFKLFAAMGALIGLEGIPFALLLAVIITAFLSPIAHRAIKDGEGVPFGPGLAIGAWIIWMGQIGVYEFPRWVGL